MNLLKVAHSGFGDPLVGLVITPVPTDCEISVAVQLWGADVS